MFFNCLLINKLVKLWLFWLCYLYIKMSYDYWLL